MRRSSALARRIGAGVLGSALAVSAWAATPSGVRQTREAPATARPSPRAGDAITGKDKAEAERCFECHGVEGQGVAHGNGTASFARLAGQHPEYIVKQLQDFRSGARKHDVMRIMAQHLEEADLRDIAAYFATRPPMRGTGTGASAAGRTLYTQGDAARRIVACVSCHGEGGRGSASIKAAAPMLGGQEAAYLQQQMLDWRSAWRTNSADGVMNRIARTLTDADIRALADYLASPPSPL